MATPKTEAWSERGFDVTVETVVGRVTFGTGEHTAVVAAFKMIGEHATEHLATGDQRTYRFPGTADKEVIEVQVSSNLIMP